MTEREQQRNPQGEPNPRPDDRQPKQDPTEDPAVGHVTEGPRDYYGRPMGDGQTEDSIGGDAPTDEYGRPLSGQADRHGRPIPTGRTDEYGRPVKEDGGAPTETPPDNRAADDTLGGYGGVAGGRDERPEQQRKQR